MTLVNPDPKRAHYGLMTAEQLEDAIRELENDIASLRDSSDRGHDGLRNELSSALEAAQAEKLRRRQSTSIS